MLDKETIEKIEEYNETLDGYYKVITDNGYDYKISEGIFHYQELINDIIKDELNKSFNLSYDTISMLEGWFHIRIWVNDHHDIVIEDDDKNTIVHFDMDDMFIDNDYKDAYRDKPFTADNVFAEVGEYLSTINVNDA